MVLVIVYKGKIIYESLVCIEYVDEIWLMGLRLLFVDFYDRVYVRIWGDFIGKKIVLFFYVFLMK